MIDGQKLEPLEEVVCELEDEFAGPVIDALSLRRAEVHIALDHAVSLCLTMFCLPET